MSMNRRDFVKKCGLVTATVVSGSGVALFSSCSSLRYVPFEQSGNQLIISKDEFVEQSAVLLKPPGFKTPIFLSRMNSDQFAAVLLKCTHRGCQVRPAGEVLVCPCHGSEFSLSGKVLSSPAEENLQQFRTKTDTSAVYVILA